MKSFHVLTTSHTRTSEHQRNRITQTLTRFRVLKGLRPVLDRSAVSLRVRRPAGNDQPCDHQHLTAAGP